MKTYIYTFLSCLCLSCLAFYYDPYIETKVDSKKLKELASITQPIRTIDPTDTNYQDLLFLKEKLKNVDLVMLGEQQHGDGATFLAKSRLIKFLHQELDFDVLLFESGLYDCALLWDKIQREQKIKNTDFDQALFYFWGMSNETNNLREYILQNAKSTNPLLFGGFDIQFSGNINYSNRIQDIEFYLVKKNIKLKEHYKHFSKILEDYQYNTLTYRSGQISKTEKQIIYDEIKHLSNLLKTTANTDEDKIFIRYLLSIQTHLNYKWLYAHDDRKQGIIRDSMMAENVIWLKDSLYKNKKVIVWAANYHIAYNSNKLSNSADRDKKMGDYLKEKYDSSCYSINFTSYSGITYNIETSDLLRINDSVSSSVESILHTANKPYAFIDFRNISRKSFLNEAVTMKCFGHQNTREQWIQLTDGIFFIDEMKPITFN